MTDRLNRRTLLQSAGTAACCVLAGCRTLGAVAGTEKGTLRRVELCDTVDEAVDVTLELERSGSVIYDGTYRLEPTSTVVNEWRAEADARRWVVRAETPDSEWRNADLRAGRPVNCHWILIEVSDSGGSARGAPERVRER